MKHAFHMRQNMRLHLVRAATCILESHTVDIYSDTLLWPRQRSCVTTEGGSKLIRVIKWPGKQLKGKDHMLPLFSAQNKSAPELRDFCAVLGPCKMQLSARLWQCTSFFFQEQNAWARNLQNVSSCINHRCRYIHMCGWAMIRVLLRGSLWGKVWKYHLLLVHLKERHLGHDVWKFHEAFMSICFMATNYSLKLLA